MHIVGLRLTNWMRFRGEFTLELGPGVYALVAEDAHDARRSNYLGKTSILRAIRWALDGARPRGYAAINDVISHGESEMGVDVEFSDGTFVSRTKKRTHAERLRILAPQPDGSEVEILQDEAQRELERRLGLSPKDQLTTCWAEQKRIAGLVAEGTKSSEVVGAFNEWLEMDRLVDAQEYQATALSSALNEYKQADADLQAVNSVLAKTEGVRTLLDSEQRLVDTEREEALLARKASEQFVARARKRRVIDLIAETERELAVNADEPLIDTAVYEREYQKCRDAETQKLVAVRSLKMVATGQFEGACPVSPGFLCPAKDTINADRERAATNLVNAQSEYDKAAELTARQRDPLDGANEKNRAIERKRGRREALLQSKGRLEKELLELASVKAASPEEEAPTVPALPDEARLRELKALLAERELAQQVVEERRANYAAKAAALRNHRAAYDVIGKTRRVISERAVTGIVDQANALLGEAGIALRIELRWERDTQSLATQCSGCGGAFPTSARVKRCERCGSERGMKALVEPQLQLLHMSGAAEDLGGIALRTAAFRWLRARRSAQWSIGVFDEPLAYLDTAHIDAFASSVQRLLLGTYEQAFITAHNKGFLDGLPRRIIVTGNGKWSTVEVAA